MSIALVEGLAQTLENLALAGWQSSGVYAADVTWPIYVDVAPQESRSSLTLSPYGPPDEPDSKRHYDDIRVQIRARGDADPRTARAKLDAIYSALHGLGPVTLPGGVFLQLCRALQATPSPMGQDASRRWEFVQNYTCSVIVPTANRSA